MYRSKFLADTDNEVECRFRVPKLISRVLFASLLIDCIIKISVVLRSLGGYGADLLRPYTDGYQYVPPSAESIPDEWRSIGISQLTMFTGYNLFKLI